ncbi:hypothetical protein SEA_LUCKYBARNES_53 [Brevibacterium phage LuckyBarnes]|uniref:Uncharacterized protein n=1 Tax=Brevibacterium phage LuckyBarnes TaxID=2027888 RepID=A0A249XNX0_9CAUD|nr:hypothetical protein HOS02_gp53 [Brevibacterium phage LuckyBarnes]ASZ73370.1 hypothetical protein SEA_LUCKYBARNES_53 [Brevibacterium phage LuckyBarnes]
MRRFGKALGLTLALAISAAGLAIASIAVGTVDPIGWAVISFGLGVFGIGAALTMMWMEVHRG